MNSEILETLGLSKNESKVYFALIKLGSASVSQIAKTADVHRVNIYDTLERLQEKGLISTVIKLNKKYYEAASPENIKNLLDKKEKEVQEVRSSFPELINLFSKSKNKQDIHTFKGISGVKTALKNILDSKPKEILNFGSTGGLLKMSPINFDIWESQREKLKISMRILTSSIIKGEIPKRKFQEIKYLPKEFINLASTVVYDSSVVIFMWAEEPLAIVIDSLEISESYRNYFNMMWKQF